MSLLRTAINTLTIAGRNQSLLPRLLRARSMVYHRTSKEKKTRLLDYDDGYYYRNGEEKYRQAMRNRQAEQLSYDDFYYQLSKNKRVYHKKHIQFPNCECAEELQEYEKAKAKQPRPVTAAPMKDSLQLLNMMSKPLVNSTK